MASSRAWTDEDIDRLPSTSDARGATLDLPLAADEYLPPLAPAGAFSSSPSQTRELYLAYRMSEGCDKPTALGEWSLFSRSTRVRWEEYFVEQERERARQVTPEASARSSTGYYREHTYDAHAVARSRSLTTSGGYPSSQAANNTYDQQYASSTAANGFMQFPANGPRRPGTSHAVRTSRAHSDAYSYGPSTSAHQPIQVPRSPGRNDIFDPKALISPPADYVPPHQPVRRAPSGRDPRSRASLPYPPARHTESDGVALMPLPQPARRNVPQLAQQNPNIGISTQPSQIYYSQEPQAAYYQAAPPSQTAVPSYSHPFHATQYNPHGQSLPGYANWQVQG